MVKEVINIYKKVAKGEWGSFDSKYDSLHKVLGLEGEDQLCIDAEERLKKYGNDRYNKCAFCVWHGTGNDYLGCVERNKNYVAIKNALWKKDMEKLGKLFKQRAEMLQRLLDNWISPIKGYVDLKNVRILK